MSTMPADWDKRPPQPNGKDAVAQKGDRPVEDALPNALIIDEGVEELEWVDLAARPGFYLDKQGRWQPERRLEPGRRNGKSSSRHRHLRTRVRRQEDREILWFLAAMEFLEASKDFEWIEDQVRVTERRTSDPEFVW